MPLLHEATGKVSLVTQGGKELPAITEANGNTLLLCLKGSKLGGEQADLAEAVRTIHQHNPDTEVTLQGRMIDDSYLTVYSAKSLLKAAGLENEAAQKKAHRDAVLGRADGALSDIDDILAKNTLPPRSDGGGIGF